ncbi:MAG: Flp pilus assembly complex ATPase component TadA [Coriobacteriia bacterium]|nr:Flp pilus assembly complex ATPase component TadA [Coriobacteriia bacterium]
MPESMDISSRVLDSLVTAGLITVDQLSVVTEAARDRSTDIGRVLRERGLVSEADVASVLEHEMGVPRVDLSSYAPEDEALALVPATVARSHGILPLFEIEGMLTVVIGDPMDVFKLDEVAGEIGLEVEAVLAEPASVLGAIVQYYGDAAATEAPPVAPVAEAPAESTEDLEAAFDLESVIEPELASSYDAPPAPPVAETDMEPAPLVVESPIQGEIVSEPASVGLPEMSEPLLGVESLEKIAEAAPAAGRPAIDLDVLAVADARKVTMLVTEILEDAMAKGASRIHLLPYKEEFFLVYRVKGGLEKAGSAPLSMQSALVDAFKSFGKLSGVPANMPALGRVHTHIAEKDVVLTFSVVPTIAGQRLVIGLAPHRPQPRSLGELGMSDAEERALKAMVERGRGLLLVAAPVAGGGSSTYYALIAHAASAGKTVYSVERSVDYEIPAVAQVMVNPGSPIPAANFIAAGLRQDTDVIAVDGLRTVEDVHLAVEAAGLGKLVIATFPAADISSSVRRMLDLGAEPHSLAAALTLGVGQRLVRVNCPNCSSQAASSLASSIPGAPKGLTSTSGSGCPNCSKTGFRGVTGIFEVLPFNETVRATVASNGSASQITAAAVRAGMRPLVSSGLARVTSGEVSAEELDRVLRFSG